MYKEYTSFYCFRYPYKSMSSAQSTEKGSEKNYFEITH